MMIGESCITFLVIRVKASNLPFDIIRTVLYFEIIAKVQVIEQACRYPVVAQELLDRGQAGECSEILPPINTVMGKSGQICNLTNIGFVMNCDVLPRHLCRHVILRLFNADDFTVCSHLKFLLS